MSFAEILEEEWVKQSEALEEIHFDAAFEAKVAEIDHGAAVTIDIDNNKHVLPPQNDVLYNVSSSSPKKSNCYSPYVPSSAVRIQGMIDFVQFYPSDIFCDIGCGDGRVCFVVAAAAQEFLQQSCDRNRSKDPHNTSFNNVFRSIGIDVSKDCIDMAQQHLLTNRHISDVLKNRIQFYQADLTIHPSELLSGMSS